MILSGVEVSNCLLESVQKKTLECLNKKGRMPCFAIIQISDNLSSNIYISHKKKIAEKIGFDCLHFKFSNDVDYQVVKNKVLELNFDSLVDGIIIQLPLPERFSDIIYLIDPLKDIDGLGYVQQANLCLNLPGLRPCTPSAVIYLLEYYGIDLNCDVAVVGRSTLVGKSLALMLLQKNSTVNILHSKTENIKKHIQRAKIVFLAAGMPNYFDASFFNEDSIVVDIGINKINNKTVGDLDSSAYSKIHSYTPVPGGIGPMTVAYLMNNTLLAWCQNCKK